MASLLFSKKKCIEVRSGSDRGFLSERKGKLRNKVIPSRGAEDGKSGGTNSGESSSDEESGAESIRRRAESTGRCVNLKTVTGIRQRSARDTFIT